MASKTGTPNSNLGGGGVVGSSPRAINWDTPTFHNFGNPIGNKLEKSLLNLSMPISLKD
jgi:hypothetical protein